MALTKGQRDREFKGTGRPPTARTLVTSTSSRSSIICRQRSYAICPSSVRLSLRVVRLSNRAPIRSYRQTTLLPTAERVRPSAVASAIKLPAFTAKTNALISPNRLACVGVWLQVRHSKYFNSAKA